MSHDPCIECGARTGSLSDNSEILVDGDAPSVTLCSYECLTKWARQKSFDGNVPDDAPVGYEMVSID